MEHVRIIETEGHPLVYADWLHAAGKPTVLVYGHYDVQPADPIDEWLSPPFEPAERNGNLYARGAVDDKGQVWAQVKALESLLAANKSLPLNVRVIFEGEEEVGGEGIAHYVASKPPELKADFALVSDTELFAPGLPTLCVGLRGMIYTEIEVRGAKTDLHSGMYGGAAPNPFVALAQILARLKDENGHILIPGFYDDIIPPSPEELAAWRSLPFDEEHYRIAEVGSRQLVGEEGLQRSRAYLGPTDARCARHSRRLHRRRSQDRHSSEGRRQGLHAPRSRHDARKVLRPIQELRGKDRPRWRRHRRPADSLRRSLPHSRRQPIHSGRDPRPARGLGQGHRLHSLRRLHSHRWRLRPSSRSAQRDDGLRPPRRQYPCPQREVQFEELRAWNSIFDSIYGGGRPLTLPAGGLDCDAAGFVLAGGQSSRMGQDKALVPFAGQPLIVHALGILSAAGLKVSIAGARSGLASFAPVVEDLASQTGLGPLAGICSALASVDDVAYRYFIPVDLPLLPSSLIAYLLHHATITERDHYRSIDQRLRANFSRSDSPLRIADPSISARKRRPRLFFGLSRSTEASLNQRVAVLPIEPLIQSGQISHPEGIPAALWFLNVNSKHDLVRAEALIPGALPVS